VTNKKCGTATPTVDGDSPPEDDQGGITISSEVLPLPTHRPSVDRLDRPTNIEDNRPTQTDQGNNGDQNPGSPNTSNSNTHDETSQSSENSVIPNTPSGEGGETSDIMFGPIDPPPSRPSRNPPPIERLSYPSTHIKDNRMSRLKRWKH
jgi:hypothetical protein